MVPLWGVLFFNWDAFYLVFLYWSENLVIGFYNILKMLLSQPLNPDELKELTDERVKDYVNSWEKVRGQPLSPNELKKVTEERGMRLPRIASRCSQ
jgi:hypothetical protein